MRPGTKPTCTCGTPHDHAPDCDLVVGWDAYDSWIEQEIDRQRDEQQLEKDA